MAFLPQLGHHIMKSQCVDGPFGVPTDCVEIQCQVPEEEVTGVLTSPERVCREVALNISLLNCKSCKDHSGQMKACAIQEHNFC